MKGQQLIVVAGLALMGAVACAAPAVAPAAAPPPPTAAPTAAQAPPTAEKAAQPAQQPTQKAAGEARVVTFASLNALTGSCAPHGTRSVAGVDLAAKQINDAGGFADNQGNRYNLKLVKADTSDDKDQATAQVRTAAADPSVLAVLGPTPNTVFPTVASLTGELKIPVVGTGSFAPIKDWSGWVVRTNPTADVADPIVMKTLHDKFGLERIALMVDQTAGVQVAASNVTRSKAQEIGYQVVAAQSFKAGDEDFRPQITALKATGAEWIGLYGAPPEQGKILLQMAELGLKPEGMVTPANLFIEPGVWDQAGELARGGYSWGYFNLASKDPRVLEFMKSYKSAYGEDPSQTALSGYDALLLAVDVVKRAGTATDREKFRQALLSSDGFQAVGGKVTFKYPPTGENQTPTVVVTRTTGKGSYEIVE